MRVRMVDSVALHSNFPKADFGAGVTAGEGVAVSEDIGLVYQKLVFGRRPDADAKAAAPAAEI